MQVKDAIVMLRVRRYELALVDAARQVTGDATRSGFIYRAVLDAARVVVDAEEARVRAADRQPDGNNAGS